MGDEYDTKIPVPGLCEKDILIQVCDNVLTVLAAVRPPTTTTSPAEATIQPTHPYCVLYTIPAIIDNKSTATRARRGGRLPSTTPIYVYAWRTIELPCDADIDGISATVENGTLYIAARRH
eukprot:scaffold134331_cov38-Prasinocladus_malaysianus.AAC.1